MGIEELREFHKKRRELKKAALIQDIKNILTLVYVVGSFYIFLIFLFTL